MITRHPVDWTSAVILTFVLLVLATLSFVADPRANPIAGWILFPRRGPWPSLARLRRLGTLDGTGAGDHDRSFRFGQRPSALAP